LKAVWEHADPLFRVLAAEELEIEMEALEVLPKVESFVDVLQKLELEDLQTLQRKDHSMPFVNNPCLSGVIC
jgi:hypothetical protein